MNAKTVTISRADGECLSLIGVHHRSLLTSITFDIVGEGDWGDGREFDKSTRHVGSRICSGKSFIGTRKIDVKELHHNDRHGCKGIRSDGSDMTHWRVQLAHFHDLEDADRIVRDESGRILEAHFLTGSFQVKDFHTGEATGEVRQDNSFALSFVFTH